MAAAAMGIKLIQNYRPEHAVMQEGNSSGTEVALGRGKLWRAVGNNCWRAILCLEGVIWITQQGDLRDHVIAAGEMFLISQVGEVLVQGLVDARMQITPCLVTTPFCGRFEDTIWP